MSVKTLLLLFVFLLLLFYFVVLDIDAEDRPMLNWNNFIDFCQETKDKKKMKMFKVRNKFCIVLR